MIYMQIELEPGVYVIAVSGGIDSVVLLHLLVRKMAGFTHLEQTRLIVAHFDHGIRTDSKHDRLFVQELAGHYDLPFIYDDGLLGPDASEAEARAARYRFLNKVRGAAGAKAVLTAHHLDDVLETAVLNILRGTGRKGLASLTSHKQLIRPLLGFSKEEIRNYALTHKLHWREDSTNEDEAYLRNYIRKQVIPKFDTFSRSILQGHIDKMSVLNREIDSLVSAALDENVEPQHIDRRWFVLLPHGLALDVMASWLRHHDVRSFDKKLLNQLVVKAKTLQIGKRISVNNRYEICVETANLALKPIER